MARYQYFSIYDSAVKVFMRPIMARSIEEAARSFRQAILTPENDYVKSPGDYTMFYLADWDEATGVFTSLTAPVRVLSALDCVPSGLALAKEV